MFSPLRFKKTRRKLISNSRGFSSIVGAVFAVLVMISLISTVFVWSLSQNTLYNNNVTQTRQADLDRANEKIVANVNVSTVDSLHVAVKGNLSNNGPLSAEIVTMWVADANPTTGQTTYAFKSPLGITLKPGNVTTLSYTVNLTNSGGDSLSCWFISARGNSIGLGGGITINNYPSTTIGAMVSQGIGSVAMNFSYFWHYDFIRSTLPTIGGKRVPADGTTLPSRTSANYTISLSNYTIFHVMLTDYDPLGEDITLNANSSIYILASQGSTVKWGVWNLVNVTNGKIYPSSPGFQVNLTLGVQTVLYFAGTIDQIDPNAAYPLNILLYGTKGGDEYGQNIPFVSVYLVP